MRDSKRLFELERILEVHARKIDNLEGDIAINKHSMLETVRQSIFAEARKECGIFTPQRPESQINSASTTISDHRIKTLENHLNLLLRHLDLAIEKNEPEKIVKISK